MICPKCGSMMLDTDSICPQCGQTSSNTTTPDIPESGDVSAAPGPQYLDQASTYVNSAKPSKKNLPAKELLIALSALAVALLFASLISCLKWERKYIELQTNYDELQADYDELQVKYSNTETENDTLSQDFVDLLCTYSALHHLPYNTELPPYSSIYSDSGYILPITSEYSDLEDLLGGANKFSGRTAFWNDKDDDSWLSITFDINEASTAMEVHNSSHYYMYGAGVGSTKDDVLNSWGTPDDTSNGYTYMLGDDGHQTDSNQNAAFLVNFQFEGKKVSDFSIRVNPSFDSAWASSEDTAAPPDEEVIAEEDETTIPEQEENTQNTAQVPFSTQDDVSDGGPQEPIHLSAGDWIAGEDFPAGRYVITTEAYSCYFSAESTDDIFPHINALIDRGEDGYTGWIYDGDEVHCSDPVTLTPYN